MNSPDDTQLLTIPADDGMEFDACTDMVVIDLRDAVAV
jgi:hypothetical protein